VLEQAPVLRVVFAGGGTGGHVFPALAIADALRTRAPHAEYLFVGTATGVEARVIPAAGYRFETLWISGFARRRLFRNLLLPFKIAASLWKCYALLQHFKPHVVVGTGGYVMGPVMYMAQRRGIPTVIQEQNSLPGLTTKKLARRAFAVCSGFAETAQYLPGATIRVTGNPVRASIISSVAPSAPPWKLDARRKTVLVFGGSLGARALNEAVAQVLSPLTTQYNLLWQTGKSGVPARANQAEIAHATAASHLCILDFIDDMPSAYRVASLAVCRAGAMTLAELFLTGLPAILIPFPYAAEDHQTRNAEAVVRSGGARLLADRELNGENLLKMIEEIIGSDHQLGSMSESMRTLARPDAAHAIADIVLEAAAQR
jgi:UDP-N-acetylglucosamine--N-acetylmuramyl-(pentapeptide) pyrophosphoryl-undecaprenol N-acetylglucosamine transferase